MTEQTDTVSDSLVSPLLVASVGIFMSFQIYR